MKNKITDLSDHLFMQLEKLNDEELIGKELNDEVKRAKAMSQIAEQIIGSMEITIKAIKLQDSLQNTDLVKEFPETSKLLLGGKS